MKLLAGSYWVDVSVTSDEDNKYLFLSFPYRKPLVEEVKVMVGARWDPDGKLTGKAKRWRVDRVRRNLMQLELLSGGMPHELERYRMPIQHQAFRYPLRDHQQKMFFFCATKRRCYLAGDLGTGKTMVAMELMELVGGDPHVAGEEWIYVAPDKVLAGVRLELKKWAARCRPVLMSYGGLKSLIANWPSGRRPPRGVIFDEATNLKGGTTQMSEAARHLCDAMRVEHGDECYILCMSGTPEPQNAVDWWSPLEVICPGFLRESQARHLEKRLAIQKEFEVGGRKFSKTVGWRPEERAKLARRLAPIVYVVRADDCLDLPATIYHRLRLEVPRELLQAAFLVTQTAGGGAQVLNKLRQLSDGFQYSENDSEEPQETRLGYTPKDEALLQLLAQFEETGRAVVYSAYTASVDRCTNLALSAGWQVLRCDKRGFWLSPGKLDKVEDALGLMATRGDDHQLCYVGHPKSGGVGLNLQGTRMITFFSNDFNGESRAQACGRGRRMGMDPRGLQIYDLLCLGTDELVLNRLEQKLSAQAVTLADIKAALEKTP